MTPDVDGHVRPAAVEVVQLADDAGRLEDRAAALLGLDAGVRRPAVDGDAQVEDPLARRDDVAVRPRALEHERDVGVGGGSLDVRASSVGEPISSSGLATKTSRSNGRPPRSATIALSAYSPASSPDFMSVTPGP